MADHMRSELVSDALGALGVDVGDDDPSALRGEAAAHRRTHPVGATGDLRIHEFTIG